MAVSNPTEMTITVHSADAKLRRPAQLWLQLLKDLVRSRHLTAEMLKRDLRSQYRQSLLGILPSLLPALVTAGWAILFRNSGLIHVGEVSMPYPFYVLSGMMIWAAFLESIDAPITGVLMEQGLISKANVPSEGVTLAKLGLVGFNALIKTALVAVAAVVYQVPIPGTVLLAPFAILLVMALGASIGLVVAPVNILYRDVAKAVPVVTTFWFFLTPVIFTSPHQGLASMVMRKWNPVTPLLVTARELAFGGGISMGGELQMAGAFTLAALLLALTFHRIAMPIVMDRVNS